MGLDTQGFTVKKLDGKNRVHLYMDQQARKDLDHLVELLYKGHGTRSQAIRQMIADRIDQEIKGTAPLRTARIR